LSPANKKMGCKASKDQVEVQQEQKSIQPPAKIISIPQAVDEEQQRLSIALRNEQINDEQEADREQDEEKVKLLLLGTGESGKSTIFKQMRILYGAEKTDDDLRMYGVIVRSNIVTAIRKLCLLTRQLGYEKKLDEESAAATAADLSDISGMTPREAYDQIIAYLVDTTATDAFPKIPQEQADRDWVGTSTRAGIQANFDSQQFLQHVEAIRVFWQVSYLCMFIIVQSNGPFLVRLYFALSIDFITLTRIKFCVFAI